MTTNADYDDDSGNEEVDPLQLYFEDLGKRYCEIFGKDPVGLSLVQINRAIAAESKARDLRPYRL